MALSDPVSLTISTVATAFPRVSTAGSTSSYKTSDGSRTFSVSHQYGPKRNRTQIRLDSKKIAPDPLISAQNIVHNAAIYTVFDRGVTGFTPAELKVEFDALANAMLATSGSQLLKILGGES